MARPSTVDTHPRREAIIGALAAGDSLTDVAARFGVSRQALGRYRFAQNSAAEVDDAPAPAELLHRVLDLADDARRLRQSTSYTSPGVRSRLIESEARILAQLTQQLGIDDATTLDYIDAAGELQSTIFRWATENPDDARGLISRLQDHPHPQVQRAGSLLARTPRKADR